MDNKSKKNESHNIPPTRQKKISMKNKIYLRC